MSIDARFTVQRGAFRLQMDVQLPGEGVTALFGPSGCGKTTALRAMAGLVRPQQARIVVNGQVWQDDAARQWLPTHQRQLGYVFQEANLFAHLSVRQNVEYGLRRIRGDRPRIAVEHAIELLGIAHLLDRGIAHLSGGEAQRVALARALATSPRLLLMDEPLAALDAERKRELLPYIAGITRELRIPVLYVTHAIDEVAKLAQHVVLMHQGAVTAQGPTGAIFTRSDSPLAQDEAASTLVDGSVTHYDAQDHVWSMRVGTGVQLLHWTQAPTGLHGLQPGSAVRLRILARDVSLALVPPQATSLLNIVPCTVLGLQQQADGNTLVRLQMEAAADAAVLLARISTRSAHQLQLAAGMAVQAQIKGVAVMQ
ncbi:MAG: molybdenum ABC transporter ATP-binding protein [Comamonas sp.]